MMRALYQFLAVLVLLWCTSSPAYALVVRFDIPGEPFPPTMSRSVQDTPIELTLQLHNDTAAPVVILLWQLHLEVSPEASALGQLSFDSVSAAPNPLFEPPSEPGPPIGSPATSIVLSDTDLLTFTGTAIAPGESRNIALLRLTASPDAQGLFSLSMREDMDDFDASSYWFPGDGLPEPLRFSNFDNLRSMESEKLASIQLLNVPEPSLSALAGASMTFGVLFRRRRSKPVPQR
jgi:hypothetical protein